MSREKGSFFLFFFLLFFTFLGKDVEKMRKGIAREGICEKSLWMPPLPSLPPCFSLFFSHALTLLLLLLLCVACMGGSHGETCGRAWGDRGKNHVGGCIYLAQWMALVPLSLFWNLTPLGLFTCSTLWFFFFFLVAFLSLSPLPLLSSAPNFFFALS